MSDDECDALGRRPADDPRWTDAERRSLTGIDELEATGTWTDATWASLAEHLDEEQRMELLIVAGWYRTICTLCNALDPRHRGLDAPLAGGRLVNLPAWAVRRTRTMSRVYFGTVVLAAAGSLVGGGAAIVSGAIDEDYSNVVSGMVSVMLGGCWAAVAHFARPMDLRKPR